MVWEKHSRRVDLMEEFFDLFLYTTTTATSAGLVFKYRMPQLLGVKQTLRSFPTLPPRARVNPVFNNYAAPKRGTTRRNSPS